MSPSLIRRLGVLSGCVLIVAAAEGQQPVIEFSVDIGSDSEMSDPQMEAVMDDVFDPGDLYLWMTPPLAFPYDGFMNDALLFGLDPAPTPLAGTVVPVGSGGIGMYPDYFDLDAHDRVDFDITQLIPPDEWQFPPIAAFPSSCVFPFTHGLVSYNDDGRPGWPAGDVPTGAGAMMTSGLVWGLTPTQDEIVEVDLAGLRPPVGYGARYGVADERETHLNMSPNPNTLGDAVDDDVDSLDAWIDAGACSFLYWSCDHEATWRDPATGMPLDPGHIYMTAPGAPGVVIKAIDKQIHLGLQPGTDVDAFEFAWLEADALSGQLALALIFSVDADDPLTPQVESGNLDPRQLYYSFFFGNSMSLTWQPLDDDIDGLAIWSEPVAPTERCDGDADGDGDVDFDDLNVVLANWGRLGGLWGRDGDTDGDQDVDFDDLNLVLGNWGRGC